MDELEDDFEDLLTEWEDDFDDLRRDFLDDGWKEDSVIATGLVWLDALDIFGIFGDFGRLDTFNPEIADTIINPYPWAGEDGAIWDERSWDDAHFMVGAGLGYLGFDETSARNFMEVFEMTEPGTATGWGLWLEYLGRSFYKGGWFEDGLKGIERDMKTGMAGYWYGRTLRD